MVEHSVDPSPSKARAEASEDSEQARVNQYLRSSDWSERLRIARLQREEVLAKRPDDEVKAPARAQLKPDMLKPAFAAERPGVDKDPPGFSGPETRPESERPEPQHLMALLAREKAKPQFAVTDRDVFAIALQKDSLAPPPLFSGAPPEVPMKSREVEPDAVAALEAEPASAVGVAMAKPKLALPRGYVGLAAGLGIGLFFGFIVRDGWVTRPSTGTETALRSADFNLSENGVDRGLAETTLPILSPTKDGPIAHLPVRILAGRAKTETTNDEPSAATADALGGPVVSIADPQSVSSAGSSETPSPESATTPVLPKVENPIRLAALQASLSPVSGGDATPAISRNFPFVAGDGYQILIHMAVGHHDETLRAQLRDLGLVNTRRIPSDLAPARTTVVYYSRLDAKVAETIAGVYGGAVVDMSGFTPNPPAHTLDLYFKE